MRRMLTLIAVLFALGATTLTTAPSAEARYRGHGVGLGIAGAIIGSAILAGTYHHHRRKYRSYYGPAYYGGYYAPSYAYGNYPRYHRHHRHHHRRW